MEECARHICVVGTRRLQNELLASHITSHTGIPCTMADDVSRVSQGLGENGYILRDKSH